MLLSGVSTKVAEDKDEFIGNEKVRHMVTEKISLTLLLYFNLSLDRSQKQKRKVLFYFESMKESPICTPCL